MGDSISTLRYLTPIFFLILLPCIFGQALAEEADDFDKGTSTQGTFVQGIDESYIAFEAEDYHLITRHHGENDGFNVVDINEFNSEFGSDVLPESSEFPASGGRALLADMRYNTNEKRSTVEYQLVFNTPGTYQMYFRSSLFERGGTDSYGGEDSFYVASSFGEEPDKKLGTRMPQDSDIESNPVTNPQEGKFFWYRINHNFVVTEQDVGKTLSFKIQDREKGFALDRLVFSLNHKLDVEEVGKDGDGNELDKLGNSVGNVAPKTSYVFPMNYVPYRESDNEIILRERELQAVYDEYFSYLEKQNSAGNASHIIDGFITKINAQGDAKSALRTLIMLTIEAAYYPEWKDEVIRRFQQEGELARLRAVQIIEESDGKINDLKQVTPIRHYIDYAWGLYELNALDIDTPEAVTFKEKLESFIATYIEGTQPYYDNAYYTTGYNKEVFAMDVASTISLLYQDSLLFPKVKEAFDAFWQNVTQMSYDGDNSPHYDANTGFHIILNMALRHGLEADVIDSEHLLRMMDRMARTVMSSGQSAKWGKSMETISAGQIRISAGGSLPWDLKMGYRLWQNPYYLYVARKYEAFYRQQHGKIAAKTYEADLWPLGIDASDVVLVEPAPVDITSRATQRITSCCEYNGLLLGRGDTNYVDVQDKLVLSTGHHPRAPYMLMDLSYTQHKSAKDHRSGIDVHNYNGAHTVTRKKRWSEANKNNGIYINPTAFSYPSAPYPSKEVSAPGDIERFKQVMGYDPAHGYTIEGYGAMGIAKDAAYGYVDYRRYQYNGVEAKRQIVMLHNGITVVSDTIAATTTYWGSHNGGVLYQILPEFKSDIGENWVLLRGQQRMLPFTPMVAEKAGLDTLVVFPSASEGTKVKLTTNSFDPEQREWLSAYKPLQAGERFTLISLVIPLLNANNITSLVRSIEVERHNETDTTVRIPYSKQQLIQVSFNEQQGAGYELISTQ
ncbi:hypothetical protein [Photobacterium minamisatsumaniensis]|uniref:hypothetical protein n=1 Tax=Photobacterium minamisatsumaniensis TaxID=2910233 RepID=UPI003D13C47E